MRALIWILLPLALDAQPGRIVSTSPSITETLFALGLGDRVVGVSQYCRYPPQAARLPRVGSFLKPNLETIARLRPDLVIMQKLPGGMAERLRALNLSVIEVDNGDLRRNLESIRAIGRATNVAERAEALIARIWRDLKAIEEQYGGTSRRVLFIVGRTPGRLEGIIAAGQGSYLSELIAVAGGKNVLSHSPAPYTRVSLESVIRMNPEVIIDMGEMADTAAVTEERKRQIVALWRSQPQLQAVRDARVFAVASDIYVVPGPRMVDAARELARLIHSETKK